MERTGLPELAVLHRRKEVPQPAQRPTGQRRIELELIAQLLNDRYAKADEAGKAAIEAAARDPDVPLYAPDALRSAEEQLTELLAETAAQERKPAPMRNMPPRKMPSPE